jgi:flagellar assembly protein FliH
MTAAAPTKFRFDLDLGHREERNSILTDSALATLVSNARAEGYRDGVADGERTGVTKAAQRLAHAAELLADHAAALNAAMDDHRHATLTDAVGLAATVGKKLARELIATAPTAEIDKLIAECLASLDAVPHLVIRCAPELADAVREIALARIATSGFTGRLVVLGDPDQASGDARIEWVDGGVARNQATLEAEIDRRVAAFVAARRALPPAHSTEEPQP